MKGRARRRARAGSPCRRSWCTATTTAPSRSPTASASSRPPDGRARRGAHRGARRRTGCRDWTRERWTDTDGRVRAESWTVHGSGHAWSGGVRGRLVHRPVGPGRERGDGRVLRDGAGLTRPGRGVVVTPRPAAHSVGRIVNVRILSSRNVNPKVSETGLPGKSPAISATATCPSSVGSRLDHAVAHRRDGGPPGADGVDAAVEGAFVLGDGVVRELREVGGEVGIGGEDEVALNEVGDGARVGHDDHARVSGRGRVKGEPACVSGAVRTSDVSDAPPLT